MAWSASGCRGSRFAVRNVVTSLPSDRGGAARPRRTSQLYGGCGRIGGVTHNDRCDFFVGLAHKAQLPFPRPVIGHVPAADRVNFEQVAIEFGGGP
jgi:hypothetical protein